MQLTAVVLPIVRQWVIKSILLISRTCGWSKTSPITALATSSSNNQSNLIFPSNYWNARCWTKASWKNNPSHYSPKHSLITLLKEITTAIEVIITYRASSSSKLHSQRGNLQVIEPFSAINRTIIVLKRWKQQLHSQLGIPLQNYNSNSNSNHSSLNPKTSDPPPLVLPLSHRDLSNSNPNNSNSRKEVSLVI